MTAPSEYRPLVTFALFAYNQETYIREAVEGAFSQTYEPLEILLSDDCSSDRTFEIMQEMAAAYDGPHEVKLMRNPKNMGVAAHFSHLINLSSGEFFVVAAGDDISMPERVNNLVNCWRLDRTLSFIDSGVETIDESGNRVEPAGCVLAGKLMLADYINSPPLGIHGATRGYRKDNQQFFGDLSPGCPTEDTPSILRALMTGEGLLIRSKLIKYRIHSKNLSSESSLLRMNIDEIFEQYKRDLDTAVAAKIVNQKDKDSVQQWIDRTRTVRFINQRLRNRDISLPEILALILKGGRIGWGMSIWILARYLKSLCSTR